MRVELVIAFRYLFAKKSHNVINFISAISAIGMAIGTAALILILSVYNGFDGIIMDNMSDLDPDLLIVPSEGKTFNPDKLNLKYDEIKGTCKVLEDNIYFSYSGKQGVARIKGVDSSYEELSGLSKHIVEGKFSLWFGDLPLACIGSSLAYKNSIHPRFTERMEIYYPKRGTTVSMANPAASLNSVKIKPSGLFSINSVTDDELIIAPIEAVRELTGYTEEVTAIEIRLMTGVSANKFAKKLELDQSLKVLDRYRQHPSLYKMMKYEKFAIFFILFFVVVIIAFNIFGSLSMLVIEKKKDMFTLESMGATPRMTKRIFSLEGWLISLLGLGSGLIAGVLLALVQQHFGIVKLPGSYLISAYPVILKFSDVLWTCAAVALIGFAVSLATVSLSREEIQERKD